MSSQGGDSAEQHRRQQLLRLIYLHLKENGYEKAANVLKKHICQKETEASVTLYEIYTGWIKTSDGFGDTKQEPGLNRESPPKKSHLSDYAAGVEGDEVKPEKGHIIEKTEEPEFKPIIDDGSVSPCNKPFIPSVVKKSSKSTEGHSDCKDDPDGDQLQTPPGHASSVPPLVELSKPTIPQEETVPLTQDMGVKVISSDSESPEDSEEEEQRPQQQAEGTTPKPTAMKTSSVAGASESKSSADSNDSQREEEAPVQKPGKTPVRKSSKQIPTKGATAAPLKSSQDTTSQALATPKISAAQNKAECSGSESNDNSVSDQEVTQDQKAVSDSPNNTATETTPAPVKPSSTLDLTAAPLKREESSDSDNESESEEAIPPTQATSTKPTVNPPSSTPAVVSSCQSSDSEEDVSVQKAVKTPKVIPAAPERPRQSVHSKAKDAPEVPAAEKKAESSESESGDDLESEEEAVKESAKPVPDTPHKATTVIVTPGLTKVPSKTEETSENDDQSEREEIPPTQVMLTNLTPSKPSATPGVAHKKDSSKGISGMSPDKEVTTSTLTTTQKTPKNGASAAPLKPSQHKSAQAKKSPKGLAVEKSESSESSNDSASEEKADGKPNAAKKTTAVMTPALVKPSTTSGRTTALSKSGEGSESDDESESEDEIPPTQKAKIPKGTPAKISPTRASKTPVKLSHPTPIQAKGAKKADSPESSDDSESEEVATPPQQKAGVTPKAKLVSGPAKTTALKGSTPGKPSYTLAPTTASSKPEESSESDDESESEEEIPPTQVMSTEPTASTHLATPAMVNRGQSSDRDSEESESEDNAPDQKPELTIKPKVSKVIPAKSLSAVTPVRAKTAPTTTSKTTMKTSVSVRRKKSTSTDSEDEIPRKSAPAKRASMVSVKPGHPIPSQVKAAPKAPSKEGKAKEASSDDSESGEDPSAKIAVAASDILPKMKCKSTTQTVQKTPNASKKVAGGSEDLSEKDASLENSALKTPKAKLRAVAPELSSDIKSSTTKGTEDGASILVQEVSAIMDSEPDILGTASSDAAPKNPKDGDVIAEELSQTSLDPKESMKKATERRKRRRRKKKKKKKKASVQFEDENISPTGPGQELILPSGGSAISLDQLITMPCKASEEPESSETGVSLKKVGSKSSKSLVSGVNSEGEPEVKTIATEAMPQAKKRRSTDKGDMEPKSKKKKKKKKGADTEANPTELGNNPHSENKLNLEESEKEALTPSDDATAKMGSDDSMESNSTTLILSAKALKKIKKMKKKEKVKVKNTGSKKIKAHKTMSVFTSVAEQLLAITKKKELKKATAVKRPLLVLDPQKRKKFDKDGTIRSEPESEIPAFKKRKKKNKSNREEKTPSKKKQTQDTEDHELQIQGLAESTLVKKKKKKKKNRWKDRGKLIKTPFKGPQGLHLDTPPPLGTSPEPSKAALGKVRKKSRSFRNSE